jgi:hypothetical protein
MGSEIIICGKRFDVGHRVVTFEDEGGYSAYVPHRTDDIGKIYAIKPAPGLARRALRYRRRRLIGKSERLADLRRVVRQVVVHLDGCLDASMCFDVLHNQRGLSVHFMVDNDGTIYQTLDLLHCAFHAAGVNEVAVGIELQNRGDAARYPDVYAGARDKVTCRVHGVQFLAYDFTEAQYAAMIRLAGALSRIFDIPPVSPQLGGAPLWTVIDRPRAFNGFIGHFHISANKWDPGPWDFGRMLGRIGAGVTFPLSAPPERGESEKEQARRLQRLAPRYFDNSEQDVEAHFPLGPLGRSRLWHGGVHLASQLLRPVRAALPGRLVAAQLGPPCAVGSCNFALLKHRLALGTESWTVFSLYYHLAWVTEVASLAAGIPWLARIDEDQRALLDQGEVARFDLEVEAGQPIGAVGEAGPESQRAGQVHFAIFSARELTQRIDPGHWQLIEAGDRGRLARVPELIRRVDRPTGGLPPDGVLSRRELRNFFRFAPQREDLHRVVVRHRSEWTPGDWHAELQRAPDFGGLPASQRRRLIAQQVEPTLWWTREVATHAGLPLDGMIYAYHPIGFLLWYARQQRRQAGSRRAGIESADRWEGKMAPKHLTVDRESAAEMTDAEDFYAGEQGKKLTLEDLVDGYPEEA